MIRAPSASPSRTFLIAASRLWTLIGLIAPNSWPAWLERSTRVPPSWRLFSDDGSAL